MSATPGFASVPACPETRRRVLEVLVEYLDVCPEVGWPGSDGLSLEEVIDAAYPAALAAGHVPDLAELVRRHPELADAFTALFPIHPAKCPTPRSGGGPPGCGSSGVSG